MGTRRAKGSRRVEDKREKEMVNTKTWRDELRRQGTAFPAWGQQADSNAPKSSPFAKENNNPRYESMYRMGGSENQPQWKKNLRSEGSAFVPWSAPDPYDHFFEDRHSCPSCAEGRSLRNQNAIRVGLPTSLSVWKLSNDEGTMKDRGRERVRAQDRASLEQQRLAHTNTATRARIAFTLVLCVCVCPSPAILELLT